MDYNKLYSEIHSLPQTNTVSYGMMIPFNVIYTHLTENCGCLENPAKIEFNLESLEEYLPDKIELIKDDDIIVGIKLLG